MGFFDTLGAIAGNMGAKAQEIENYKREYKSMSDSDLIREGKRLKNKSGERNRYFAVGSILIDRGYDKHILED